MAMYTCMNSSTGYRNKGSFSFSEFYYSNDRAECAYSWASPFLIHGLSVNPRILYGLRQSTLLQWSASRRLIWGGSCGIGCCRQAEMVGICGRGGRVFCFSEEGRRERRVGCSEWERGRYGSINGGSVNEMLSLLTDVLSRESVGVRESDSRSAAKSVRKKFIRRDDICDVEKEVRVDECSQRQEKQRGRDYWERHLQGEVVMKSGEGFRRDTRNYSSRDDKFKSRKSGPSSRRENQHIELGSQERMSKGGVVIESEVEVYRHPRGEDFLRDDIRESRKSSSSYYSVESLGDLESNMEEVLQSETAFGESSSASKNDLRRERKDVSVEEVRQHKKYGSSARYGESSTKSNTETQSTMQEDRAESDVVEGDFEREREEASGEHTELLESHKSGTQRVSKSENRSETRMVDVKDSSTSSSNLVYERRGQYVNKDQQVVGKIETRKGSKKLNRTSDMHEYDSRAASSSQSILDSRVKYREESVGSDMNLNEETRRQHSSTDYLVSGQSESRSNILTEVFEINDTDVDSTFYQKVKDNSTLVLNSSQQAREQRNQNNQKELAQIALSRESQRHTNEFGIGTTDTKRVNSFERVSKSRINEQEKNSGSALKVQEAREQQYQMDEEVIGQHGSQKDSRKHTTGQEYHGNDVERASSSSQTLVNVRVNNLVDKSMLVLESVEEPRKQQMGVSDVVSRKPLVMVTPPQTQVAIRGSPAHAAQADENLDSGSGASYTYQQRNNNSDTVKELDSRIQKDETYKGNSVMVIDVGALDSADRLHNSSAKFVGEFVDILQQEISASDKLSMASKCTSKIQEESTTCATATASVIQDEQYRQQSRMRISTGSLTKGPPDEMWDVAGTSSSLETSEKEAPLKVSSVDGVMEARVQTNAGNATGRRSSRSLWSFISDLVRKGWHSHAESRTPTMKSVARTASNESLNSESWFSGDEPEDNHDENARKSKSGILKEQLPTTQIQHASESMRSQEKLTQMKSDASTSTDLLATRSTFKSPSSGSGKGDFELIDGETERQLIPSRETSIDSSFPLTGVSTSSSKHRTTAALREELSESGKAHMSTSGVTVIDGEPIREGATETSLTEERGEKLKRRKLQRNKQVLREHFDEWEEAFMLEHEQRKTDEMFMREALLEAKQAGDSWEVPVGAVLVQNGKIIARGCNLVEELRDSTAHAEMICIREASNLLRTWRLAETTLYVTLEPCPMCAGAILQARIDTVVWGAPNKLLGADGSWVSLFPSGDEGGNTSNRPPGPVHPFHPKITIRRGILATECSNVMQQFFQLRRKNKKPEPPPHLPVSNHPSKFLSKLHRIFNLMFCL